MESSIQDFLPEALQGHDTVLVFGVGFGLLLFLIILIVVIRRSLRRARLRQRGLVIQSFQIAPLGRDAFLKISNPGPPVTLLNVHLVGRQDLKVKNEVTGQQLPTAGNYSILLEAVGDRRLDPQFQVELSFADAQKVHYQQLFALSPVKSLSIKKKR